MIDRLASQVPSTNFDSTKFGPIYFSILSIDHIKVNLKLSGEVKKPTFGPTRELNNGSPYNIRVIHDDGFLQEVHSRAAVPRQSKLLSVEVDLHCGLK